MEDIRQKIAEIITRTHKTPLEQADEILLLLGVVGRSEQSCKHPDSCAMGYYHQIGDYYCSKCLKTGLQD